MKKQFMVVMMLLAVMTTLAGCPQNVNPQVADTTNDAAEAVSMATAAATVNLPDSTAGNPFLDADNPYADDMGVVVVDGNFAKSAKSLEKSINWNWIVDDFIGHADKMTFNFWPHGTYGGMGKGGGYSSGIGFEVDIETGGQYHGEFAIRVGEYDVYTEVKDAGNNTLFNANSTISVVAGQSNVLALLFELPKYFGFRFMIPAMPGEYEFNGQATITLADGETFSANYYNICWECADEEGHAPCNAVVFYAYLPIDFDGENNGAELMVLDANGDMQVTELNFNIFDVDHYGGNFKLDYAYPEDVGTVTVDIDFVEYPDPDQGKG